MAGSDMPWAFAKQYVALVMQDMECIDVYVKTDDTEGDGYATIYQRHDDPDTFEVGYLRNRVPKSAWETEDGINEAESIFEGGSQTFDDFPTRLLALESIYDYWNIAPDKRAVTGTLTIRNGNIMTLVITQLREERS